MNVLLKNLRYAARMLFKSPGFTAVAVLALGLGIGANTAIFSLADVLLYRPLELPDLDRVVTVIGTEKGQRKSFDRVSPADFLDFQRQTHSIENLGAGVEANLNLTGDGEPERVEGARASVSFFKALGARPAQGRIFLDGEDTPGQDRVVILGHTLWTGRFASDPHILSRTIQLEGQSYRVVGVMPKDFRYPPGVDLWIPLAMGASERGQRSVMSLDVVGRLRDGISVDQADSELAALAERISELDPEAHRRRSVRVELLRKYVSGNLVEDFMVMLMGSVAFVLLIACSNVANLQFARVSLRSKEMAIRSALGASRFRLLRQFLVESALLGMLGALFGLLLAFWGLDMMRSALPTEVQRYLPGWERLGINGRVLWFTLVAAVMAGVVSGIVPAWFGSRADLNEMLKESGRGTSSGVRRHRIRSILVVCQIVLALVLMVGAGLIAKGSALVTDPAPGLDPTHALTMRISLPESKYPGQTEIAGFQERLLRSVRAISGIQSAAVTTNLPYSGSSINADFTIEGRDTRESGSPPAAINSCISADYFSALHLPVLEGRAFTDRDGKDAPLVAIVSRTLVNQYFPSENPIGRHIKIGLPSMDSPWLTIVGVVGDLRRDPFDKFYRPALYRPYQQHAIRSFDVLMRTAGDPKALSAAARAQVFAIDSDQPIYEFKTLEELFDDQLSGFRFLAVLMGVFGLVALFLSSIGVYAVMAYSVNERTHEIGVRMALGASPPDVVWMIVRRGLVLTGTGLLIGLPVTLLIARLLANIIFGVREYDPAMFGTGLAVLAAAALLACYIPARRATRVDPMATLRTD
jgi:putative ABC transport system permease protein